MITKPAPLVIEAEAEAVRRLLAELGDTPVDVALSLYARGFRGKVGCAVRCPVAEYLRAHGLDDAEVYPSTEGDCGSDPQVAHVDCGHGIIALSQALDQFLIRFDGGEFPGLVAP